MQKVIMVALATTLMSTTAMGGERTVTVPTPKSITLVCSDDVRQGTIVLSNPPKFSCKDYSLVNTVIGTGITVGPDANVNRIIAALRHANRRNEFTVTKNKDGSEIYKNGRSIVTFNSDSSIGSKEVKNDNRNTRSVVHVNKFPNRNNSLDDFGPGGTVDKFSGLNSKWFNEVAPIKVSDDPSRRCSGWVNLNDILSGKCGKLQATVKIDGISVESK